MVGAEDRVMPPFVKWRHYKTYLNIGSAYLINQRARHFVSTLVAKSTNFELNMMSSIFFATIRVMVWQALAGYSLWNSHESQAEAEIASAKRRHNPVS
jgi:hypothetical protein